MLGIALLLLVAASSPAEAPERITHEQLMQELRGLPGVEAKYREEKHFGLLAAPLISEGTVHFAPPRLFARHQQKPAASSVVVKDDELRFGDEHGTDRIDLPSRPEVGLFVDSFLELLEGDEEGLRKLYEIEWTGGTAERPRDWTLKLKPRRAPMKGIISRIEMSGVGPRVDRMDVVEVGGDRTLTEFTSVDTARSYSEAEQARIFSIK